MSDADVENKVIEAIAVSADKAGRTSYSVIAEYGSYVFMGVLVTTLDKLRYAGRINGCNCSDPRCVTEPSIRSKYRSPHE